MKIAEVKVAKTTCKTTPLVPIPRGIVGAVVAVEYTDFAWDSLRKTVVFRGAETKDVLDAGSEVTIPAEVVSRAGVNLYMGVYGVGADGRMVIPTIWTELGLVHGAAAPSGDTSTDPSLPVWAQIQGTIGNLDDLDTDAKSSLVAAINEALTKGGGEVDPAAVQKIVDDYLKANPPQAGADGKDGITPTIGENGNWYLGDTDTGKPSRGTTGANGKDGANGKTAYQYAQDGGYTGTETDFIAKLAQEILSGTTDDLTPAQVYAAVSAGRPVKVQYTSSSYGVMSFAAFNTSETMGVIASQNIVYYDNVYILAELGGYIQSGQWFFNSTVLAEKTDIPTVPTSLKSPYALTIKIGGNSVTYDGSAAKTVEIADGSEVSYLWQRNCMRNPPSRTLRPLSGRKTERPQSTKLRKWAPPCGQFQAGRRSSILTFRITSKPRRLR